MIRYLSALPKTDVGRVLPGVVLTDASRALEGYTFLGRVRDTGQGSHVYVVETRGERHAFAWVEKDGVELPLPECPGRAPGSAFLLSGDVYRQRAIQSDANVVEAMCVAKDWVK